MDFINIRKVSVNIPVTKHYLQVRFSKEMMAVIGVRNNDIVEFGLDGELLYLSLPGNASKISSACTKTRFQIKSQGIQISYKRLPDLKGYDLPLDSTQINYEIQEDKMIIDLSSFKKVLGFNALKSAKKVSSFAALKTAIGG